MEQLEDKLGAILENPQLMQQIMQMAQSLSGQDSGRDSGKDSSRESARESAAIPLPQIDPSMLSALTGIASQTGMDSNQKALLTALHPYLSARKINKLEKAMRASRLAQAASGFLGQGGLRMLTGR